MFRILVIEILIIIWLPACWQAGWCLGFGYFSIACLAAIYPVAISIPSLDFSSMQW
jgi:hypothetical protein